MRVLLVQIQNHISRKIAQKPESLQGISLYSQNTFTQYVAVGPITQGQDVRWYANFEVTWIDSLGRIHF